MKLIIKRLGKGDSEVEFQKCRSPFYLARNLASCSNIMDREFCSTIKQS